MEIKRKMFFLSVITPIICLCSGAILVSGQVNNSTAADADTLEQGKRIYARECSSCHGDRGKGDGPAAIAMVPKPRDLAKVTANKNDDRFFLKISGGASSMPAYKGVLSDIQIRQVIAYIRTLGASSKTAGDRP